MKKISSQSKVAILLAFYEGYEFIDGQIKSIFNQSHKNIEVWISDESRNRSVSKKFLSKYKKNNPFNVFIIDGPGKGSCINFLHLACNKSIRADFYAFSDQDDLWESDKLTKSLNELLKFNHNIPSLFGSRSLIVDINNNPKGLSPLFNKKLAFTNAIVQNFAGGNSMLFNHSARKLLVAHGSDIEVKMHDWWLYLLVSGADGNIIYSKAPLVRYRQHSSNVIGENNSIKAKVIRVKQIFDGSFKSWINKNNNQLLSKPNLLSIKNYKILQECSVLSEKSLFKRLNAQRKIGLYRQTLTGNIALYVTIIFGLL